LRYASWLILVLLLTGSVAAGAPGDDLPCVPYQYRIHWTGEYGVLYYAEAVQVVGSLAYVADRGLGLRIVDVSDPARPTRAGGAEFGAGAHDLVVEEPLVYLAIGPDGLHIMDVTNPQSPTFVGNLALPGAARHLVKHGDLIYVSCGPGGLQIVDVADPTAPVLLGGLAVGANLQDVALVGSTVLVGYVDGGVNTVRAIDVSDPAAPTFLGMVTTPNTPAGITVSGDLAYVACGDRDQPGDGCVQVLDVIDPAAPVAGAVLPQPPGALDVLVDGGTLWSCGALTGDANFGYVHAFDLVDPALPVFRSETVLRHWVEDLAVANGHLCLAAGYYPGPDLFHQGSLQVVAVPSLEVAAPLTALELDYVASVAVAGDLAYLAAGSNGLRIIDASDPYALAEIGVSGSPGYSRDVALVAGFAYLADGFNGLQIVDVSDPAFPALRGATGATEAWSVDVAGSLACVASIPLGGSSGYLEVIDVTDPDLPLPLGGLATAEMISDLVMDGNLAYLTVGDGTLRVVDITDPLTPYLAADVTTPAVTENIAVAGPLVYLGCGEAGTAVYDISDFGAPEPVGVLGGLSGAVAATSNRLYVTLGHHGLQIAGLPCGDIASVGPVPVPVSAFAPRAHPNPFNPRATISFVMARTERVEIAVYDLTGRRISVLADRVLGAGEQTVQWNGRDLAGREAPSGIYLLRMTTADRVLSGKATLLR